MVSRTHSQRRAPLTLLLCCYIHRLRVLSATTCEEVQASHFTSRHYRGTGQTLPYMPTHRSTGTTWSSISSSRALWSGSAPEEVLGRLQAHHLRNKQLVYCL